MIKINRLSDYAVVLLAQLVGADMPGMTTNALAEQANLPLAVVRKLMQLLRDGGLVEATQGHKGGYSLTRSASQITLYHILSATQGQLALTQCSQSEHQCGVQCQYQFEQHWQQINNGLKQLFSNISLQDMMQQHQLKLSLEEEVKHG